MGVSNKCIPDVWLCTEVNETEIQRPRPSLTSLNCPFATVAESGLGDRVVGIDVRTASRPADASFPRPAVVSNDC